MSQYPLLSSTICPLSFSTSHCIDTLFCDRMTTATLTFYPLSVSTSHCTLPFFLCLYVQSCLVHSVHFVSVPHSVESVGFVSIYPLLTVFTAGFYNLSTVCQYRALCRLLVLYHNVHRCLLQSLHCLSVTNAVYILYSVSLSPLLSSTVCHFCQYFRL